MKTTPVSLVFARTSRLLTGGFVSLLAGSTGVLTAQTFVFTQPAEGTYNWSTGSGWIGGSAPVGGVGATVSILPSVSLTSGSSRTLNNDLSGSFLLNGLNLGGTMPNVNGTTAVTLSGGNLSFVGAGEHSPVINLSANRGNNSTNHLFNYAIGNSITLNADTTVNATGTASFVFSGAFDGPGALLLKGNGSGAYAINGAIATAGGIVKTGSSAFTLGGNISGAGGLTQQGSGVLTLSGVNTYTGDTVISSGVLHVGSADGLSANSNLVLDGGVLRLAAANFTRSLGTEAGQVQFTGGGGFHAQGADRTVNLGGASATVTWGSGGFIGDGHILVLGTNSNNALIFTNGIDLGGQLRTIERQGTASIVRMTGVLSGGAGGGLIKTGEGVLQLNGANANTYTGDTVVEQGELNVHFSATAGAATSNLINSDSRLVLGGSAFSDTLLRVTSKNSSNNSQAFDGTWVRAGLNTLAVARGNGTGSMTVDLGAIDREKAGVLGIIAGTNGTLGTTVHVHGSRALENGIIGGWATYGGDWATIVSGNITAYSGYTNLSGATPAIASAAASNVRITSGSSGTVTLAASGVTDINTIQVTDAANRTIDIGVGNTLRLGASGGIWRAVPEITAGQTGNRLTIDGGTLTAGGAADTAGEIVFNTGGGNTSSTNNTGSRPNRGIVVNSVIADNGSGKVSLVKTGFEGLVLAGANTYTGDTHVLQGFLESTVANNLGGTGASVYVLSRSDGSGGQVRLAGAGDYTNQFFIAGNGTTVTPGSVTFSYGAISFDHTDASISGDITLLANARIGSSLANSGFPAQGFEISGRITGDYDLSFGSGSQRGISVRLSNTANDWGGDTILAVDATTGDGVDIWLGASEVLPHGDDKGNLVFSRSNNGGNVTRLNLNGYNETVNALISTGTNYTSAAHRVIRNQHATDASTLTIGANGEDGYFYGTIQDGGAAALALTKIGTGTQELAGANTYTGATTINGGTLLVSGSFTGAGAGVTVNNTGTFVYTNTAALGRAVSVGSGGTFNSSGGNVTGIVSLANGARLTGTNWNFDAAALTVASGVIINPGNGVGSATGADMVLGGGGVYELEMNAATGVAGINWDVFHATLTLDLVSSLSTSSPFVVKLISLDALGAAGVLAGFDGTQNYSWQIATSVGGIQDFTTGGFVSSMVAVDTAAFQNAFGGEFSVSIVGNSLMLDYVGAAIPEPSAFAAMLGAFALVVVVSRRRA